MLFILFNNNLPALPCATQSDAHSDADNETGLPHGGPAENDYGADEDTIDRLTQGLCDEDLHDDNGLLSKVSAVVRCKAEPCLNPLDNSIARRQSSADNVGLTRAMQSLKDKKLKAVVAPSTSDEDCKARQRLQIQYDAQGRPVQARILLMTPPARDNGLSTIASVTVIARGQTPPYVLLPLEELPNLETTIALHNLCKEQEVVFRIIMGPLSQAMDGELNVPQLKFAVLGTAGEQMHRVICNDPMGNCTSVDASSVWMIT